MGDPIRIAIVDDESLFLEGLSLLFSNKKSIVVTVTSGDGNEFLDVLSNTPQNKFPDVALVDIQMKPMNGFELVENLKEQYPDLKIIILSSYYKANMIGCMIKLGVSAFMPKNTSRELLFTAIESVYKTGVYFSAKDRQLLTDYMNSRSKKINFSSVEDLSKREIEVVKLICLENTNQEIADKLFLSKRTIESHRQRILEKIGAKNTVGLVVYAIAHEIYILPPHFDSV